MAKRSSGAAEINGFIAINNTKPGKTQKNLVLKKANNSKKDSEGSNKSKIVETKSKNPTTNNDNNEKIKKILPKNEIEKKNTQQLVVHNKDTTKINDKLPSKNLIRNKLDTNKQNVQKVIIKKDPIKIESQTKTRVSQQNVTIKKSIDTMKTKSNTTGSIRVLRNDVNEKKNGTQVSKVKQSQSVDKIIKRNESVKQLNKNRLGESKKKIEVNQTKTRTNDKEKTILRNKRTTQISSMSSKSGTKLQDSQRKSTVKVTKPKENDNLIKSETKDSQLISRQGTWVKEKAEIETSNVNLDDFQEQTETNNFEGYESDFEDESKDGRSTISELNSDSKKINKNQSLAATNNVLIKGNEEETLNKNGDELMNNQSEEMEEASSLNVPNISEDCYDYDDDFEDYESDFEEDTESGLSVTTSDKSNSAQNLDDNDGDGNETDPNSSSASNNSGNLHGLTNLVNKKLIVEEEKKLDSGNYDLHVKMVLSDVVKQRQLDEIKEAISRENTIYKERDSAEGHKLEPVEDQKVDKIKIMNFKEAHDKHLLNMHRIKAKNRAEQLLNMITLHPIHINLFEMAPIPYDAFIKCYGKSNSSQAIIQTSDDALDEEIQTEQIFNENKWTQHPIKFHRWENNEENLNTYLEDQDGCGSDGTFKNFRKWRNINCKYNGNRLSDFMNYAGQIMLILLEENEQETKLSLKKTKQNYEFSDGFIQISVENLSFLKDRTISDMAFSPFNPNTIITSHRAAKDIDETFMEQYFGRSVICQWNILQPLQPIKILVAPCQISIMCFDDSFMYLIHAGLTDGTVCLWDLSESIEYHQQYIFLDRPILRSPTYCTYDINQEKHFSTVIALKSFGYGKQKNSDTSRLISLSEDGKIIIWSVIQFSEPPMLNGKQSINELGMAYWGRIKLVFAAIIDTIKYLSINEELNWSIQFLCMTKSFGESPHLLIGSNIGQIVHAHISGAPAQPISVYQFPSDHSAITCIEICPHNQPIFLAGCNNGTIRMHKTDRSYPIRIIINHNLNIGDPLTRIKWSILKPGLIIVMDKGSNIIIYNLTENDVISQSIVPLKKYKASNLDISKDRTFPYMAFTLKKSLIQIHKLKSEFSTKDTKLFNKEYEMFKKYVQNLS